MVDQLTEIKNEEEKIRQGGGAKAIESQHKKGRLTARERIAKLIDPAADFFELGLYAAYEMYEEWGGAPAAGTITGLARVAGRQVMIIANDATVKAGAFFPMTAKKVIRAQNIAIENHIPTIYLVDSAGVFLPLQEDVFPDTDDFGRVFRNNAVMSAMGIPQITAIMGMCVAGGAYLPVMCDHILMTEGSGLFLAGPGAGAGGDRAENFRGRTWAAQKCTRRSAARWIFASRTTIRASRVFARWWTRWATGNARPSIIRSARAAYVSRRRNLRDFFVGSGEAIRHARDHRAHCRRQRFEEYRAEYGQTVLCGFARIGGWAVGIVANQKKHVHNRGAGHGRAANGIRRRDLHRIGGQGGAIYSGLQSESDSADFSARRERIHGGQRSGMERHHSRGREDGERRGEQRGAEDFRDLRRQLWRRALRDVRKSVRSAVYFCVADGALRGDGRRMRRRERWWKSKSSSWNAKARKLTEKDKKELVRIRSARRTSIRPTRATRRRGCGWMRLSIRRTRAKRLIEALEAASLNPDVAEFKTGVLQT